MIIYSFTIACEFNLTGKKITKIKASCQNSYVLVFYDVPMGVLTCTPVAQWLNS
jgi:hypothetical protein